MPSLAIVSARGGLARACPHSALWDLRFRKSECGHDSLEPLAAPPDGSPLRFAPSFLQPLEPGPFMVVLGGLDFCPLGFWCLSSVRIFFAFATIAASAGLHVAKEPKVANKFIDDPGCRKIIFISSPRPLSFHAPHSRGPQEKIRCNCTKRNRGCTISFPYTVPRKSKKVRHLLSVNEKLPLLFPIPHDD